MHYEIDQKNWSVSMDLKDFYFQNIQKDEYHYRFYDSIENVNNVYNIFSGYTEVEDYEFEVYDAEEAITKFRELCQPDVLPDMVMLCGFSATTAFQRYLWPRFTR